MPTLQTASPSRRPRHRVAWSCFESAPEAVLRQAGEVTTVRAMLRAPESCGRCRSGGEQVGKRYPGSRPLRADQDLVSVSTSPNASAAPGVYPAPGGRQAWPRQLPAPVGVVGDGIKVWRGRWYWSVRQVLGVDSGENAFRRWTAAVLDVGCSPPAAHPSWPLPRAPAGSPRRPGRLSSPAVADIATSALRVEAPRSGARAQGDERERY